MLTRSQSQLLTFVYEYTLHKGYAPSYQDIMDALDLSSKSCIASQLDRLEERGYIRRLKHRARAIEVLRMDSIRLCPKCHHRLNAPFSEANTSDQALGMQVHA